MKNLLLVSFLFLSALALGQNKTASFAHPNYTPAPYWNLGQMLNITNTYSNKVMLDTVTGSTGTIYLYIADAGTPVNAVDTFVPYPLWNSGSVSFQLYCTKVSGSPNITASLEESTDGFTWVPVNVGTTPTISSTTVGTTTTTYTNTNPDQVVLTATGAKAWDMPINYTPYHRMNITTTTVSQSSACKAYYANHTKLSNQ